jgi:translation initiation factor IF-2
MAAPRAGAPRAALGGHAGDEGGAVPGCPRRAGRAPWPGRARGSRARADHTGPGRRHGRRDLGRRRGWGRGGRGAHRGGEGRADGCGGGDSGRRGRRGGEGERDRASGVGGRGEQGGSFLWGWG